MPLCPPAWMECLSSTSHRCSIGLRSGEFGCQVNTTPQTHCCAPKNILNHFCFCFFELSCRKRPQPSGNTVSMKGCTSATMLRWVVHIKVMCCGCGHSPTFAPLDLTTQFIKLGLHVYFTYTTSKFCDYIFHNCDAIVLKYVYVTRVKAH